MRSAHTLANIRMLIFFILYLNPLYHAMVQVYSAVDIFIW